MADIVQFINDRLDEDEAVARKAIEGYRSGEWEMRYPFAAGSGVYVVGEEDGYVTFDQEGISDSVGTDGIGRHIARHDPARVLREVEAKRAIIEEHRPHDHHGEHGDATFCDACQWDHGDDSPRIDNQPVEGFGHNPCRTLAALAAIYADHPDYDPAWR